MQLHFESQRHDLTDIREFRSAYGLSETFGVALFEPKDFTGLASIEHAGIELNTVRSTVLDAIPNSMPLIALMDFLPQLRNLFKNKLYEINNTVNLKDIEIDFAVNGFDMVNQQLLYALGQGRKSGQIPTFFQVYQTWLDESVRVSQRIHEYIHNNTIWEIQIINYAYGRCGLVINTSHDIYFVRDDMLACPAEGFMFNLLRDTANQIIAAVTHA